MAQSLAERNGEPVEGLRQRISELEEIATDYGMKFQKAQDALKHQALLHKSQMEAAEKRIAEQSAIVTAAEKLVRCKGRYHGELNYRALAKLFGVTAPDLPPLEHENVHYADAAEMEIAALRQRIAELGGVAFNPAILDVVAERQRQKTIEGWTPEHDDEHCNGELAMAAVCYINETGTVNRNGGKPWGWPWDASWWKPKTRRRNLVKAGALILAEIERLDRAAGIGVKGE
ncbi:TPA: ead/Ea22-like family protein [Citrobacter freundii]|nr:ead/Ea22-like family protein [Citrobacter freundii]HDQ2773869.1 ead/Ea22-like family protein [Citrobacter freundii]